MSDKHHLLQIRNGVYLLCVISIVTLIIGVILNLYLTNRSINEMKAITVEESSEQALINELNLLLEANKLDTLIAKCEDQIKQKPLSGSSHYYLGLAYYHKGDANMSQSHLEEALRIDPTWKAAIEPYLENL